MSEFADMGGYALLETFRGLFNGRKYKHRDSSLGDLVASRLYEDLIRLGISNKLLDRVREHGRVVNLANKAIGKISRRGDGTFGELVPAAVAVTEKGCLVARGPVANIEIGAETKILAKAMIKQIDRVIGDLGRQVEEFRKTGGHPICVGIVGVNCAQSYTSYEAKIEWPNCPLRPPHGRDRPRKAGDSGDGPWIRQGFPPRPGHSARNPHLPHQGPVFLRRCRETRLRP